MDPSHVRLYGVDKGNDVVLAVPEGVDAPLDLVELSLEEAEQIMRSSHFNVVRVWDIHGRTFATLRYLATGLWALFHHDRSTEVKGEFSDIIAAFASSVPHYRPFMSSAPYSINHPVDIIGIRPEGHWGGTYRSVLFELESDYLAVMLLI